MFNRRSENHYNHYTSALDIYDNPLLDGQPFNAIPTQFHQIRLDPYLRVTYLAVTMFANLSSRNECFATLEVIADTADIGIDACRRSLNELVDLGMLERKDRKGRRLPNVYKLVNPLLWKAEFKVEKKFNRKEMEILEGLNSIPKKVFSEPIPAEELVDVDETNVETALEVGLDVSCSGSDQRNIHIKEINKTKYIEKEVAVAPSLQKNIFSFEDEEEEEFFEDEAEVFKRETNEDLFETAWSRYSEFASLMGRKGKIGAKRESKNKFTRLPSKAQAEIVLGIEAILGLLEVGERDDEPVYHFPTMINNGICEQWREAWSEYKLALSETEERLRTGQDTSLEAVQKAEAEARAKASRKRYEVIEPVLPPDIEARCKALWELVGQKTKESRKNPEAFAEIGDIMNQIVQLKEEHGIFEE